MILVNKNSKIILEVLRAELTHHSDLVDSVQYTVAFGNQLWQSSPKLRHRDILNPVFNEVYHIQSRQSNFSLQIAINSSFVCIVME
jgi:hypothetical protein